MEGDRATRQPGPQPPLYDAFISYSHAADGRLAPAIQRGLHRFAKPWWRLRALRVFRDQTSLATSPELWPSIETALHRSRCFLYLASPQAARSFWVQRELNYWLSRRPGDTLLIVLTEGELVWDRQTGEFDWSVTDAFPREVVHGFNSEPLWLDLRDAREAKDLSLNNPSFRLAIADLVSALTGRAKDELIGEDVRRHRQTRRIAWAAAAGLGILTVTSIVAAVLAILAQQVAQDRQQLAQSRQLASQSVSATASGRLDFGMLLGVEAMHAFEPMRERRPDDDVDARAALLQSVFARPQLKRYVHSARNLSQVVFNADGDLALGFYRHVAVVTPEASRPQTLDAVESFAPGDPFARVAVIIERKARIADLRGRRLGKALPVPAQAVPGEVLLDPTGYHLAVAARDGLMLWDTRRPLAQARRVSNRPGDAVEIAFSPDGEILATTVALNRVRLLRTASAAPMGNAITVPGRVWDVAFSADGSRLVVAAGRSISFWNTRDQQRARDDITTPSPLQALALHPGGQLLATVPRDGTEVQLRSLPDDRVIGRAGQYDNAIREVAFSPDGNDLVVLGRDGSAQLWGVVEWAEQASTTRETLGVVRAQAIDERGERIAVGSDDGSIRIHEFIRRDGKDIEAKQSRVLKVHEHSAASLVWRGDRLLSASCLERRGSVCIGVQVVSFDLSSGQSTRQEFLESAELQRFWFSGDGTQLAVALTERRQPKHSAPPSGYQIWRFDLASAARIGVPLMVFDSFFARVGYRHADRLIAISGPNETLVWNVETGREAYALPGGLFSLSEDGSTALTANEATGLYSAFRISIWDGATGAPRGSIATGLSDVRAMALSPDGSTIAASDDRGGVHLWDLSARRVLGVYPARERVVELMFVGNEEVLAIERSGRIVAFTTNPERWRQRACSVANRNLSYEEWREVFDADPYRLVCPEAPVHASVLNAGRALADQGDIDGAVALMRHAQSLGDMRIDDPRAEAIDRAYKEFRFRGKVATEAGDAATAEAMFSRAKQLKPEEVAEKPGSEARRLSALALRERSVRLARLNLTAIAMQDIQQALQWYPQLEMGTDQWFELCLAGVVSGDPEPVADACESANGSDPRDPNHHDARGVVLALLGKVEAAIAAFEAFVRYEQQPMRFRGDRRFSNDHRERVQTWLKRLRDGQPPFDGFDLGEIRSWRAEPPG